MRRIFEIYHELLTVGEDIVRKPIPDLWSDSISLLYGNYSPNPLILTEAFARQWDVYMLGSSWIMNSYKSIFW